MSLRGGFRIRQKDGGLVRGKSLQSDDANWFDYLKTRKLDCKKKLDTSYGNITQQQTQLRSVIRGSSLEAIPANKQNTHISNMETVTLVLAKERESSKDIKSTLRALTHLRAADLLPSKVDNFHLNQQLIMQSNDPLWNKITPNSRTQQILLFKSSGMKVGQLSDCIVKISKMHKRYIVKVTSSQGRYGLVLNKEQWQELWKSHSSYEQMTQCFQTAQKGKLVIKEQL